MEVYGWPSNELGSPPKDVNTIGDWIYEQLHNQDNTRMVSRTHTLTVELVNPKP